MLCENKCSSGAGVTFLSKHVKCVTSTCKWESATNYEGRKGEQISSISLTFYELKEKWKFSLRLLHVRKIWAQLKLPRSLTPTRAQLPVAFSPETSLVQLMCSRDLRFPGVHSPKSTSWHFPSLEWSGGGDCSCPIVHCTFIFLQG